MQLNRAQRRLLAKNKGREPVEIVRPLPKHLDELRVFAPITAVLDQLATGEIETARGDMVMPSLEHNEYYAVTPALAGWIKLWERIGHHHGTAVPLDALKRLHNRLHAGMLLQPSDIEAGRAEIEHQRQLFRHCDRQVLRSLANTESIALYMKGKAA